MQIDLNLSIDRKFNPLFCVYWWIREVKWGEKREMKEDGNNFKFIYWRKVWIHWFVLTDETKNLSDEKKIKVKDGNKSNLNFQLHWEDSTVVAYLCALYLKLEQSAHTLSVLFNSSSTLKFLLYST